jgi:hypothetical protein
MTRTKMLLLAAAIASAVAIPATTAHAQASVLIKAQSGAVLSDRFRVDSSGAFVAYGFARDVLNGTGCAAQLPATGASTRFQWEPCRGSLKFGRVPVGRPTNWDDLNNNDFTFAGGDDVIASGQLSFAFGNQVNVSSTVGVGFGSAVTVSGTAGFSSGAQNVCSGFACTALGYTVRAGGQGSVALGFRTSAIGDYTVALGYRASSNVNCPTHAGSPCTGTFAAGDESTTDSVRNQTDNEFRARYNGGFRLRVSTAANGNTPGAGGNVGCDLTVAVPSWTCASSRTLKENFRSVSGEDVLKRLKSMPITTWNMTADKSKTKHLGPVAEDFYSAFGLGIGRTTIGMNDIDGVTIAAAKALEARTTSMQTQLKAKDEEIAALKKKSGDLEARVARLEALIEKR